MQSVLHEKELHIQYCEDQGVSLEQLENAEEDVTTIAYTRFLLDVANTVASPLAITVATAPCFIGFARAGSYLAEEERKVGRKNQYTSWVHQYASAEYQDVSVLFFIVSTLSS